MGFAAIGLIPIGFIPIWYVCAPMKLSLPERPFDIIGRPKMQRRFFLCFHMLRQLFYLIPILRRFKIIKCIWQAAVHVYSALFNYTPLVIEGTDKNKQLTIFKPTQTGINRNK
jgi:hypothetical protein